MAENGQKNLDYRKTYLIFLVVRFLHNKYKNIKDLFTNFQLKSGSFLLLSRNKRSKLPDIVKLGMSHMGREDFNIIYLLEYNRIKRNERGIRLYFRRSFGGVVNPVWDLWSFSFSE